MCVYCVVEEDIEEVICLFYLNKKKLIDYNKKKFRVNWILKEGEIFEEYVCILVIFYLICIVFIFLVNELVLVW